MLYIVTTQNQHPNSGYKLKILNPNILSKYIENIMTTGVLSYDEALKRYSDVYKKKIVPVVNFIDYAVFVSFFPLLVAGPIERASHFLPQIVKSRKFNYTQAKEGSKLIMWGLFKKVVIADSIATIVDSIYGNYHTFNGYSLLIAAIAFSTYPGSPNGSINSVKCTVSGLTNNLLGISGYFMASTSSFHYPYNYLTTSVYNGKDIK
jgi:hypothetical protein